MKLNKLILIPALFMTITTAGCSNENFSKAGLNELEKYVVELAEYQTLDYEFADNYYKENNDNWGGGCSSISKIINGHRIVGRNMDLNISYKNAYIIRTNAGKYKTLGLAYSFRKVSPDYNEYKEKGISDTLRKILPFMCDDVLNDQGLHVEINMRHNEFWPNGGDKYSCEGTNNKSSKRVYLFELPRYIGEHCATVEEAKEYVASLDVYSQDKYWGYCFLVSDAVGNSSLLEFCDNKVYWLDESKLDEYTWLDKFNLKAIGQTNFYLNEWGYKTQDIKSGEGRFITLQNDIDSVNSEEDMYNLMRKIQYSSFYLDYDECKNEHFDPRSENIGEIDYLTYDTIMNPEAEEKVKVLFNSFSEPIRNMTREEKQQKNAYWESSFTEVIDTNAKSIFVRIFENDESIYSIDFNQTKKVTNITEWIEDKK